jgi:hypothetical protein
VPTLTSSCGEEFENVKVEQTDAGGVILLRAFSSGELKLMNASEIPFYELQYKINDLHFDQ